MKYSNIWNKAHSHFHIRYWSIEHTLSDLYYNTNAKYILQIFSFIKKIWGTRETGATGKKETSK